MKKRISILALILWTSASTVFAQMPAPLTAPVDSPTSGVWSDTGLPTFMGYFGLDYLLWWMKPVCLKVPVLTSGSTADAVPGAMKQPGTKLLVGESKFEFPGTSGIRPRIGLTLSDDGVWAVEAEGFFLATGVNHASYSTTNGSPRTYLPYQAPDNSQQALPFTIPGVVNGNVSATGTSHLWGAEANVISNLMSSQWGDIRVTGAILAGFRHINLRDRVVVRNTQTLVADPSVSAFGEDHFNTHNEFYGLQLGNRIAFSSSRWSLEAFGKLAAGETRLASDFSGTPLAGNPVQGTLIPGPIQVLPSNAISQSVYRVSLAPEIGFTARFALSEQWLLTLGYNLLYWNRILCPGDLMDTHVNTTQLPFQGPPTGAAVPAIQNVHTDYFQHGLSAGLEWRF